MFRTTHAVRILAAPEEVWALIKDITKWKTWLLGVQQVQLHGPLISGAQGLLFLGDGKIHEMLVQKYAPGHLELIVKLPLGVKLMLSLDVSSLPLWSQIKMEGQLLGAMAFLHAGGWGKNLKNGIAPTARLLGILSQEIRY